MSLKRIAIAVAAITTLTLTPSAVFAQTEPTVQRESGRITQEERLEQARAAQSARRLERCEAIKTKLSERATKVTERTAKHAELYGKLLTRLDTVIAKATEAGADITALTAAKTSIEQKIDAFSVAAEAYTDQLVAAESVSCDEGDTNYGKAIVDARESLRALRDAAKDVHQAFRTEAVPAITALAQSNETSEETQE